jgi:predicted TIM-barrel fold metal-dependent hydrolase
VIIDAHCHVGEMQHYGAEYIRVLTGGRTGVRTLWWDPSQTWQPQHLSTDIGRLLEHQNLFGIDRTVIVGFAAPNLQTRVPAEYVAEVVRKHAPSFVGFHSVDPIGGEAAADEVRYAVDSLGLRGVKLHPAANDVDIDDRRAWPIYATAQDLDVPLLVHTGWCRVPHVPFTKQRADRLNSAAHDFPGLRLVLAHAGFPWIEDALAMLLRYPNVWADTADWAAWFPVENIARTLSWAKQVGVLARFIWGSDYPVFDPRVDLALYRSLPEYSATHDIRPRIEEEDVAGLLGGNAMRLLNLDEMTP